jgi:hypothetical protein
MKIAVTSKEAEELLQLDNAVTLKTKSLKNFRTAYLDNVGTGTFLVTIDGGCGYLFVSPSDAEEYLETLN